jgi:hypothetical protein
MAAILAMDTLTHLYSRLVLLATATSSNCQVLSLQTPPKPVPQLSTTVVLEQYAQEVGIEWEWMAMDGAMVKAPLGGKGNRG